MNKLKFNTIGQNSKSSPFDLINGIYLFPKLKEDWKDGLNHYIVMTYHKGITLEE